MLQRRMFSASRWSPSVTTSVPITFRGAPSVITKMQVKPDWFAARKVSPRFVVDQYEKQEMKKRFKYAVVEDFEPGDSISMQYRQNLKDPKDVPILIEGIVIARRNSGLGSTFTIVNKFGDVAVQRKFPLYSPFIKSLLVIHSRHVRRSKLYFMENILNRDTRI